MGGIGAIRSYGISSGWEQAQYYMQLSSARLAGANPAQADMPVEPVDPVRALPSDVPVKFPITFRDTPLPVPEDLNNAADNLARMRIHFPGNDENALPAMLFPGQKLPGEAESAAAYWPQLPGLPDGGDETEESGKIGIGAADASTGINGEKECRTCAERKYQDGSDDSAVSFQSPTSISPARVEGAVRSHEHEHVVRERAKAEAEDRRVVSQSVAIHTDVCPECGRIYVSGGTTRTVTVGETDHTAGMRMGRKHSGGAPFGEVA